MKRSSFFEGAFDTGPCRQGWHLRHTMDDEPVYFRRVGRDRALAYLIAFDPSGGNPRFVVCAPNEGPWLCEACGTFVSKEACVPPEVPVREK